MLLVPGCLSFSSFVLVFPVWAYPWGDTVSHHWHNTARYTIEQLQLLLMLTLKLLLYTPLIISALSITSSSPSDTLELSWSTEKSSAAVLRTTQQPQYCPWLLFSSSVHTPQPCLPLTVWKEYVFVALPCLLVCEQVLEMVNVEWLFTSPYSSMIFVFLHGNFRFFLGSHHTLLVVRTLIFLYHSNLFCFQYW